MTTLGHAQKILHPEGVAAILSRRRKVWSQIPNKTKLGAGGMVADRKVWPDARTGAKGQRPTHGRAGAGLASPAGTGVARVCSSQRDVMTIAQPFMAGSLFNPFNQVPAGTKESPALAKGSAVPRRELDGGRAQAPQP